MAEPEEMEEDLFADLYDGEEAAGATNTTSNNAAVPIAPAPDASATMPDPGYGEEPETAMAPTSFDSDIAGDGFHENGHADDTGHDISHESSAPSREPFSMKEDGFVQNHPRKSRTTPSVIRTHTIISSRTMVTSWFSQGAEPCPTLNLLTQAVYVFADTQQRLLEDAKEKGWQED